MSIRSMDRTPQDERTHEERKDLAVVVADPFNTPFDDEEDDEWWNDERPAASATEVDRNNSRGEEPRAQRQSTAKVSKTNRRVPVRPYSVRKPTRDKSRQRQKKQNAKAGIKVVTDFSSQKPAHRNVPQQQVFVDLAALQALDQQDPKDGGFWRSVIGHRAKESSPESHETSTIEPGHLTDERQLHVRNGRQRPEGPVPLPVHIGDDLSPDDRPIMIGLTVPSAKLSQHITSPETATTTTLATPFNLGVPGSAPGLNHREPETPTIRITPEQKVSAWVSSIQSPITATKTSRNSNITVFSEDEQSSPAVLKSKPRITSSNTIFEEDESPVVLAARRSRANSARSIFNRKESIDNGVDRRESKGWWNHVLSPFLSRSNTLHSPQSPQTDRPDLPNLATADAKLEELAKDRKTWEKQLSPLTPETSTTIASDAWWESRNTIDCTPKQAYKGGKSGTLRSHRTQESSGTLPFMLSAGTLENSAHQDKLQALINNNSQKYDVKSHESTKAPSARFSGPSPSDRVAPFILVDSDFHAPQDLSSENSSRHLPTHGFASDRGRQTPRDERNTPLVRAINGHVPNSRPYESHTESPQPPPYSPPRRAFPKYRVIYPPGHASENTEPSSPGPLSPGLQQAMNAEGGIALADVPLTPPPRRPINLNSGYPGLPASPRPVFLTPADVEKAAEKSRERSRKVEAKRRRYEREDAIAHRAGGLWRGRGCVPDRGCYGRSGAEGRKRRRCWFGLIAGLLSMIILTIVLATQLHHGQNSSPESSQWLNLTGFPPIFIGVSTIASPENPEANTGCVFPATLWSCALPKELQSSVAPNPPDQPNFRIQIQWDNSSEANATFANLIGNNSTKQQKTRRNRIVQISHFVKRAVGQQNASFTPSPPAPNIKEQFFLGDTTDNILSPNKSGEPTPFYITFLSPTTTLDIPSNLLKRDSNGSDPFPNVTSFIPPPSSNSDGTAAPANLLPLPVQQPIRLYDRGLPTEHYGFYNYFDRSIFLKSTAVLNASNTEDGEVPDDENGGATESEALTRCTWAQTRFLVQMWTAKNSSSKLLNATTSIASLTLNETANDFKQPGSFPYPVTITTDRHGGDPSLKMIYCYGMDNREHLIPSSAQVHLENRAFGGTIVNPAPSLFSNTSNPGLGGFDGGTSGCSCQWSNWQLVTNT